MTDNGAGPLPALFRVAGRRGRWRIALLYTLLLRVPHAPVCFDAFPASRFPTSPGNENSVIQKFRPRDRDDLIIASAPPVLAP